MRFPHNPGPYDDAWEDQPARSGLHQYGLGIMLPVVICIYGTRVLIAREAVFGGWMTMLLRGPNATAYGIAALALAVFLHLHYFWGNILFQAWFAVLGKILSAGTLIACLGYLIIEVGIWGRNG